MKPPEFLETDRLRLRVPALSDAASMLATYGKDAEVTRYLTWRPHESLRETERFIAQCIVAWDGDARFPWAMVLKSTDEFVGMIEIRLNGCKAEVGYVLARPFWSQGLMTEALRHVKDWALSQPAIYRVWAYCDVDNIASARVLEKVGMQHEGILHRYTIHPNIGDIPRDCHCYAIVK